MKILVYIFVALLILSCANNKNEAPAMKTDEVKQNEFILENAVALEDASNTFIYKELAAQKLQDYFDLLVLQKHHPEFKEDIHNQLQKLLTDSIAIPNIAQKVIIKNVQQISDIQHISDSVQKVVIRFDITFNHTIKTDSIVAIIKTKKINLDNKEVISTKISFLKEKFNN